MLIWRRPWLLFTLLFSGHHLTGPNSTKTDISCMWCKFWSNFTDKSRVTPFRNYIGAENQCPSFKWEFKLCCDKHAVSQVFTLVEKVSVFGFFPVFVSFIITRDIPLFLIQHSHYFFNLFIHGSVFFAKLDFHRYKVVFSVLRILLKTLYGFNKYNSHFLTKNNKVISKLAESNPLL
jgi:hypothetical protein